MSAIQFARVKSEMIEQRFIQQLEYVPDTEGDEAAFVVLEQKVENVAKHRFGCIGKSEKNRLAHEFELIRATNTAKLFLYWADIVAAIRHKTYPYIYSVQNCSLVSYCLGITEVNPLLTGSYFERLLTRRSTHVPILFIEVPKGQGAEASESLEGEVKSLIEIEENAALPDLDPIDVMDFFKRSTFDNRELLQSAASSLGLAGQKSPKTVRALADLLVYKRYKEFMNKKPSLLYQENAVDLLVKAGLSYEEAECVRRAFAMKNRGKINFYRKIFERAARKNGYSINEANAMFSAIEKEIDFTVCRASYVAMAQYLYMDMFFQEKTKG